MLTNYLKIAFRSLLKFKGYALINLFGLALGLTAGILIMIYVLDELSFDKFHVNAKRLYRIDTSFFTPGSSSEGLNQTNGWPLGKILEKDFPEVEKVLYTRSANFLLINHNDRRIRQNTHFATPEFFEMFSFPLLEGNTEKALAEPYSVVISEEMAAKYFHGEDALNKTLVMADTLNMVVTGIMKNIPSNSHIQADMILSFATYEKIETEFSYTDGWGNINMHNYLLLKEGADFETFAAKSKNIYMDRVGEMMKNWGATAYVKYEPLEEIYLKSKAGNSMGPAGNIDRIYLLSGIAAFVILLACINFVNLATARSVYRAKEVGLRKVVGSTRQGLISQFLSESFVLTVFSLIIALVLTVLFLPYFNQLLDKKYDLIALSNLSIIAGVILLTLVIALLSGYYPALVMSALRPVEVLKGKMQTGTRGIQLRRALVVFQFIVSVTLVTGTLVVMDQLKFMQQQELGFDKDQIIVINASRANSANPDAFETFKNELKSLAAVEEVTWTNAVPGSPGWTGQVAYPEGKTGDEATSVEYMAVDDNYLKTLGLEIIAGRGFDKNHEAELKDGLILNESAVTAFGWTSPEEAIGKRITSPSGQPEGEVIGVVKNYHQLGLQRKIGPITMDYAPQNSYLYGVRYDAAGTSQLIESLTTLWKKTYPGYDFNYFFLDQNFEKQYQSEQRLANVFGLFAVITIAIAVIGLLGLVSFMVAARTKEIGIRKVLGAGVFSITGMLSKEFVILVLIANVIAFPLAGYFADQWLEGFAFRMKFNPLLFAWTTLIAVSITLFAVSYQTIKAALANPIKSLRHD